MVLTGCVCLKWHFTCIHKCCKMPNGKTYVFYIETPTTLLLCPSTDLGVGEANPVGVVLRDERVHERGLERARHAHEVPAALGMTLRLCVRPRAH